MSSGTTFDPSREWLGIDAVDLADPRRVLGLTAAELDREAIIRAADDRLAMLRDIDPGPFTLARAALMNRVTESRDGLLASLPARAGSGFAPPPPPGALPRPAGSSAAPGRCPPAPPSAVPAAPSAGLSLPLPTSATVPTGQSAETSAARAARRRAPPTGDRGASRRTVSWLLPLLALATLAALGVAFRDQLLSRDDRRTARVPDAGVNREASLQRMGGPDTTSPASLSIPKQPSAPQPVAVAPGTGPREQPAPRVSPAEPDPAPPVATPGPQSPPPGPAVTTATNPPRPVAVDAGRIDDLLAAARTALAAGHFDRADEAVRRARDAAPDGSGADRVAGWEQLASHARRFASFRGQALKAGAGRDFEVGQDVISVIEVNDRTFIFRHAGHTQRIPVDEVPEAIAMTMTRKWFAGGGQAANHLFVGARYLTRPEPDPAAARKAWLAARAAGEDVSLLMPLLDDPLLRAGSSRR